MPTPTVTLESTFRQPICRFTVSRPPPVPLVVSPVFPRCSGVCVFVPVGFSEDRILRSGLVSEALRVVLRGFVVLPLFAQGQHYAARLSLLHGATKEKETKEPCVAVGGLGLLSRRSGSNRRSRAADRLSVEACLASAAEGSPRTSDPKPVWRDLSETNPPPAGPGDGTFVIRIRILCILHVTCMYSACILMCPVIYIKIHFRYMYLSLWPSYRKCILPRDMYPSLRYIQNTFKIHLRYND